VWIIGSLTNHQPVEGLSQMVNTFGQVILGHTQDRSVAALYLDDNPGRASRLIPGTQAIIPTAEQDFRVWIPCLEEDQEIFLDQFTEQGGAGPRGLNVA
jgi:hypothetical protein